MIIFIFLFIDAIHFIHNLFRSKLNELINKVKLFDNNFFHLNSLTDQPKRSPGPISSSGSGSGSFFFGYSFFLGYSFFFSSFLAGAGWGAGALPPVPVLPTFEEPFLMS